MILRADEIQKTIKVGELSWCLGCLREAEGKGLIVASTCMHRNPVVHLRPMLIYQGEDAVIVSPPYWCLCNRVSHIDYSIWHNLKPFAIASNFNTFMTLLHHDFKVKSTHTLTSKLLKEFGIDEVKAREYRAGIFFEPRNRYIGPFRVFLLEEGVFVDVKELPLNLNGFSAKI